MHKVGCVLGALATALALLPASASAAIDPGVNYDPGSPAGKEYAIPLVQGRADGAGTENQQAAANTPFGAGIKPPGGGAGGKGAKGKPGSSRGAGHSSSGSPSRPGTRSGGTTSARHLSPALAARVLKAAEPQGTALLTIGMAVAVLLASAALAVALRRRPQQHSR